MQRWMVIAMAENYKLLYEQMLKIVDRYQNEIVPDLREQISKRVEVVLCENCEYYNEDNMSPHSGWCEYLERGEYNKHFCSYAKRRADNGR